MLWPDKYLLGKQITRIELTAICTHHGRGRGARGHFPPEQEGMKGFLEGDRGEARAWYLSPALGEKQRVFQHHMEAAEHFLLAIASFGLQLGGAAGDHGGGELHREGQRISPTPALRPLGRSLPRHPLRAASRSRTAPSALAQPAAPRGRSCPADTGTPSPPSPGTRGPAHTGTPAGRRRAARDNLHRGRVSAQKQKGRGWGVAWTNLLQMRFAICRHSEVPSNCVKTLERARRENKTKLRAA